MKLRQLFESAHHKATASFCFGRFNPAHQGHAQVWEAVANAGQHWYIGTNPTTIGPNDPLPFNVKTAWMTAIDPSVKGHIVGEQSVVTLASKIYQEVGDGATVAYITDHKDWMWSGKLLHDYNGKEGAHGYYKFAKIIHVESPRVTSATDLRNAARAGDEQTFYRLAGVDPKLRVAGKTYFETVAEACGHHPEKVKRAKKEKAIAEESNLIKYANRIIREMRAREFLAELSTKPTDNRHSHAVDAGQGGGILMRDIGGYDRTYHLNRIMMAAAMADGRSKKAVDMPDSSFVEKYNVAFPYTDEEQMMMYQALATIPSDSGELDKRGKSQEPKDTNKVSPVNKPKKNKYGI
jgi:hypothetical protein